MISVSEKKYRRFGAKLLKYVDPSYKVIWEPPHDYEGPTWNGTTIHCSETPALFGIHDIIHCLLASPRRRRLPEFGLGPDPAGHYPIEYDYKKRREQYLVVSPALAQKEENRVCDLHWSIAAYIGGIDDAKDVYDHLYFKYLPKVSTIKSYAKIPIFPKRFVSEVLRQRLEFSEEFEGEYD